MTLNILHAHSYFSSYDGYGSPEQMAKRAKQLGSTALALTDHGNMSGAIELYTACKNEGIKPILGIEAYFQEQFDNGEQYREENKLRRRKHEKLIRVPRYHMTLLAKSKKGYQSLCGMLKESVVNRKFYYTPIFDWETLEKYCPDGDVIMLSGCPASYISQLTIQKDVDKLESTIEHFLQIFGDNFYFEVMPHDFEFTEEDDEPMITRNLNKRILKLAKAYDRPVVLTTDSHYQQEGQYANYLVMHELRHHQWTNNYSHLYMPTEDEVKEWWSAFMKTDPQPMIDMTQMIADQVDIDLTFKEMVPKIDWGDEEDSDEKLQSLAIKGMKRRGLWTREYKDRMKYELSVIKEKGFADYFLLCYSIIRGAKKKGIAVGFGRGSVCGSLLAYCIGITNVDPLIFGTKFERFLRPNKMNMPDVDMDFGHDRRDEVFHTIMREHVGRSAKIASFGKYHIRSLLNELCKVMQVEEQDRWTMTAELIKLIPDEMEEIPLDYLFSHSYTLKQMNKKYSREYNGKKYGIMWHFCGLYGQIKFVGQHPAGVAITCEDIENYIPLMLSKGQAACSYDMASLSKLNVVKMDILGLNTATILQEIEKLTGTRFTYELLEDRSVYNWFKRAKAIGIFQFDSRLAMDILRKVQPDNIDELVACTALGRPAPIQLGLLDAYVRGKNGDVDDSTVWAAYTQETFGTIIYQEQVMLICKELAHMEWADIDKVMKSLRQTVAGPDPLRDKFVKGAVEYSNMDPDEASNLYQAMTLYLFNKGHGVGYVLMSFYQMWLKIHYPIQFWFATIKHEGNDEQRLIFEAEAVRNGIIIAPATVNSDIGYTLREIDGDLYIERGLATIYGVGGGRAECILEERKTNGDYLSREDAVLRLPQRCLNSAVLTSLDNCGAFDFDWDSRADRTSTLCNELQLIKPSYGRKKKAS